MTYFNIWRSSEIVLYSKKACCWVRYTVSYSCSFFGKATKWFNLYCVITSKIMNGTQLNENALVGCFCVCLNFFVESFWSSKNFHAYHRICLTKTLHLSTHTKIVRFFVSQSSYLSIFIKDHFVELKNYSCFVEDCIQQILKDVSSFFRKSRKLSK